LPAGRSQAARVAARASAKARERVRFMVGVAPFGKPPRCNKCADRIRLIFRDFGAALRPAPSPEPASARPAGARPSAIAA
jgi:hypothetical protein